MTNLLGGIVLASLLVVPGLIGVLIEHWKER